MLNLLFFALLAIFWGGSFVAIKFAIAVLPPFLAGALRSLAALTLLSAIFLVQGRKFTVPRDLRSRVWIAGLFAQGIPFSLLFWGERSISPGLAGILNGTTPLWTLVLGAYFAQEKESFTAKKIGGLLLGLGGVILIFLPELRGGSGAEESDFWGTLAVTGMAICYAVGTLLNRRLLSGTTRFKVDFHANIFQHALISFAYLFVISLLSEGLPSLRTDAAGGTTELLRAAIAITYLGWCSTALAFLMFFRLVAQWGAVRASSVNYLLPAMAILISYLFYGKLPEAHQLAGSVLILAGVLLVQIEWRALARPRIIRRAGLS